jgi:hypothetical protein
MKRERHLVRTATGTRTGIAALLAAIAAAVVVTLAGCAASAQSTTPGPGGQPTPTKTGADTPSTQPTPTKTTTGRPAAALPKATCGRASTHGLGAATRILSADKGALSCFHVAARDCKTASIAVTEMGVDTGTNHVFAIEPGGKNCAVTELSQLYSANFGGSRGKIGTVRCSVAAVTGGGVTLSCAGHRLLIPAAVSGLYM